MADEVDKIRHDAGEHLPRHSPAKSSVASLHGPSIQAAVACGFGSGTSTAAPRNLISYLTLAVESATDIRDYRAALRCLEVDIRFVVHHKPLPCNSMKHQTPESTKPQAGW